MSKILLFVQFIDLVIKKAEQGDFEDTHLITTSYSSMWDPKDLLLRIPPLPTIIHLLHLKLQREHMSKHVVLIQNRIPPYTYTYIYIYTYRIQPYSGYKKMTL